MTIERPMFPPRAESVDSFSVQPAPDHQPDETPTSDSPEPAGSTMPNVIAFRGRAARPVRPRSSEDDDVPITKLFSNAFFVLPFVTLPSEKCGSWGEFWNRVVMWNDEPTEQGHIDCARGRQYARDAIKVLRNEGAYARQLEIVVERIIEGAFRRRGPGGKLCRRLSSAEHAFLDELCKIAVGER